MLSYFVLQEPSCGFTERSWQQISLCGQRSLVELSGGIYPSHDARGGLLVDPLACLRRLSTNGELLDKGFRERALDSVCYEAADDRQELVVDGDVRE